MSGYVRIFGSSGEFLLDEENLLNAEGKTDE
jgi:hypothetical protein